MSYQAWRCNSQQTLKLFCDQAQKLFEEHKYVTFRWAVGEDRSYDQNALFHVWLTEYAAHLINKNKKDISPGELAGMKRIAKREYYLDTGDAFMVHKIVNPRTGDTKTDYTSSKDWKRGEMFNVLTWLQLRAANDGLVLESKGEFNKLQREQAA